MQASEFSDEQYQSFRDSLIEEVLGQILALTLESRCAAKEKIR